MQHKKKSKQTLKIKWILLLIVIMIAIAVIAIITINKKEESATSNQSTDVVNADKNVTNSNINATTISDNKTEDEYESNVNLVGTYIYNENVKYEFKEDGKGAMYDSDTKFEFTYTINDNKLEIDFTLDALHDASYNYTIDGDILTLVGGEGTTGGEYKLQKETK